MDRPSVGVGLCIKRGNEVLLHKRKGKHAPGTWAFAGGHLEKWEDFESTALRELVEEAGSDLKVTEPKYWTTANTMFRSEDKHYVVVFMASDWISGEPKVMEPEKCEEWGWFDWDDLPSPLMQGLQILKDNDFRLPELCL